MYIENGFYEEVFTPTGVKVEVVRTADTYYATTPTGTRAFKTICEVFGWYITLA